MLECLQSQARWSPDVIRGVKRLTPKQKVLTVVLYKIPTKSYRAKSKKYIFQFQKSSHPLQLIPSINRPSTMTSPLPYNRQTALASAIAADNASSIAGKIVLTTGVTQGGLGATFVETIAQYKPRLLILAGRSAEKVGATVTHVNPGRREIEAQESDDCPRCADGE